MELVASSSTRIFGDYRSCERDKLLLTLRQSAAALVYYRVVAVFLAHYVVVDTDYLTRLAAFLERRVKSAVADIIEQRSAENKAVLKHYAHLRAERLQSHL